jgi:UDP-glucuronate 4-epimerase
MQAGDVTETFVDVGDLMSDVGFRPDTSIEDGIGGFVAVSRPLQGLRRRWTDELLH